MQITKPLFVIIVVMLLLHEDEKNNVLNNIYLCLMNHRYDKKNKIPIYFSKQSKNLMSSFCSRKKKTYNCLYRNKELFK